MALTESEARAQFDRFDADGSGEVSVAELAAAFKACMPDADDDKVKELSGTLVEGRDTDGSKGISWEEFKTALGL